MTDTTPADKVWAKLKAFDDSEWLPVFQDCGQSFQTEDGGTHWLWDRFQRHVGPTPPDAKEPAMQSLNDLEQAFDAAPPHVRDALLTVLSKPIAPEMWRIREEYVAIRKAQKSEIMDDAVDWYVHDGSVKRPKCIGKRDEVVYCLHNGSIVNELGGMCRDWSRVDRYRIINRAAKLPKIKIVIDGVKYTVKLKRLPTRN